MAKNKENNGLFGSVMGLAEQAKQNIEERNTQHTHDTQRTQTAQRKQKHPRINMAFYGDNLDYVREAAYAKRVSVTEYINQLIVDDKNRRLTATKKEDHEQLSIDDVK